MNLIKKNEFSSNVFRFVPMCLSHMEYKLVILFIFLKLSMTSVFDAILIVLHWIYTALQIFISVKY